MDKETTGFSESRKVWHVENTTHPELSDLITTYNLEEPKPDTQVVEDAPLTVRGWALSTQEQQSRLHLVLRFPSYTVSHPMNNDRSDVIEKLFNTASDGYPQIRCGFSYTVLLKDVMEGFEIGFEADGYIYTVARVCMV